MYNSRTQNSQNSRNFYLYISALITTTEQVNPQKCASFTALPCGRQSCHCASRRGEACDKVCGFQRQRNLYMESS